MADHGAMQKKKPQSKKPFKLNAKAKLGRGRMEPVALIETMQDADNWQALQDAFNEMDEEDQDELREHFGNGENFGIGNDQIADALFGQDDGDTLVSVFESLNEEEKQKVVDELYNCNLLAADDDD